MGEEGVVVAVVDEDEEDTWGVDLGYRRVKSAGNLPVLGCVGLYSLEDEEEEEPVGERVVKKYFGW